MSFHRLVALVATTALVGLLGMAEASNAYAPRHASKVTVEHVLREKIKNANIQGCGG